MSSSPCAPAAPGGRSPNSNQRISGFSSPGLYFCFLTPSSSGAPAAPDGGSQAQNKGHLPLEMPHPVLTWRTSRARRRISVIAGPWPGPPPAAAAAAAAATSPSAAARAADTSSDPASDSASACGLPGGLPLPSVLLMAAAALLLSAAMPVRAARQDSASSCGETEVRGSLFCCGDRTRTWSDKEPLYSPLPVVRIGW